MRSCDPSILTNKLSSYDISNLDFGFLLFELPNLGSTSQLNVYLMTVLSREYILKEYECQYGNYVIFISQVDDPGCEVLGSKLLVRFL